MKMKEKLARLRLIRTNKIGPVTFNTLLRQYGSGIKSLEVVPQLARNSKIEFELASESSVKEEYEKVKEFGGEILVRGEEGYPAMLDAFDDSPGAITIKGHPTLFDRQTIALVGSRNASANSITACEKIARELGEAGFVVVSGMARGIDAAAHRGSLFSGTIAVLAGGIDQAYPRENVKLYNQIAEQGLIMVEMPFGMQPLARHFPMRNRLIAALSTGVVVVEAGPNSGSLISAREAIERGREVMAIPGSPLNPRSQGCNSLIREGAVLVQSSSDIIEGLRRPELAMIDAKLPMSFTDFEKTDTHLAAGTIDTDEARTAINTILGYEATEIDELIRQCAIAPSVMHIVLLEMELAGEIMRHFGNRVSRIYKDQEPQ